MADAVLEKSDAPKTASLRAGTLNLFDATVVAVSSVAPAYSLAATLSLLFVAVAYAGPATIIVSFFPILFIAAAYFYLNRRDPNCGACYAWLSKLVSLLPFLSGLFCFWVAYEVIMQSGIKASAPVLVALGLGVPLAVLARLNSRSDFFERHPVAYDAIV
jgi:amino acid transporter